MKQRSKVLVSWSSGKDAAWTLHILRQQGEVEIAGLLTVVSRGIDAARSGRGELEGRSPSNANDRVAMHAVRESLLEAQAERVGVPLWKVPIPDPCSAEQYAAAMARAVEEARSAGVRQFAFGDLFLEDVRAAREKKLAPTGLSAIFPLWGRDTSQLAAEMIAAGLKARLVSVDPKRLEPSFAGRELDAMLLRELPPGVDPCGEYGEFHTFVHDGPMFSRPVPVLPGPVTERDGYWYADLLLGPSRALSAT
ncbi:MAG: protein of unknown function ATP-binding region [Labilithrix sp.]|nr:protein of unknown function ATP-binding region [Labilithrix sp.]